MITKIDIRNTATFDSTTSPIDGLKKINYFFGANGTGKTTISRVIADSTDCITWAGGTELATRVYNRDFVERVFKQQIPGVFTLGEQEIDTLAKIKRTKGAIDDLTDEITRLTVTLQGQDGNGGKKQELSLLETNYTERFWISKQRHEDKLRGGLRRFMGSKRVFKEKVLSEAITNTEDLLPLDELYTTFEGDDKIKCKDLCSWVNDGSHSGGILSDEHYSMPDDITVDRYLRIFKEIFEKCGHTAHYNMMMELLGMFLRPIRTIYKIRERGIIPRP